MDKTMYQKISGEVELEDKDLDYLGTVQFDMENHIKEDDGEVYGSLNIGVDGVDISHLFEVSGETDTGNGISIEVDSKGSIDHLIGQLILIRRFMNQKEVQ